MVVVSHGRAELLSEAEEQDILWEIAGDVLGPAYREAYKRLFTLTEEVRVQYIPPFRHMRRAVHVPKAA